MERCSCHHCTAVLASWRSGAAWQLFAAGAAVSCSPQSCLLGSFQNLLFVSVSAAVMWSLVMEQVYTWTQEAVNAWG